MGSVWGFVRAAMLHLPVRLFLMQTPRHTSERTHTMDSRVALISIIVENPDSVQALNDILHTCGSYIIGRMGIPYREKGISIISIAIDAPQDVINTLSGKIGKLPGVTSKTAYSNVVTKA